MANKFDLLLINPPYHRRRGSGSIFPLGLGYLAAYAERSGYCTGIIDCAAANYNFSAYQADGIINWLCATIAENSPRLAIGIGPCTVASAKLLEAITAACRDACPATPIIFGGPMVSIPDIGWFFFERLGADAVIPGDGEEALVQLLDAVEKRLPLATVQGIGIPDNPMPVPNAIRKLNNLPFPKRNALIHNAEYSLSTRRDLFTPPFANVIASRGCPHACSFCASGPSRAGVYSRRSMQDVASELRELVSEHGIRSIVFYDDTFFPSPETLERDIQLFAGLLDQFPTKPVWQVEMRPDTASALSNKLSHLLYASGCRQINLGVETASSQLATVFGKDTDTESLYDALLRVREGAPQLRVCGTFILGGPGEDRTSIGRTIQLAKTLDLLFAHFYPLEVYPGTRLHNDLYGPDASRKWYDDMSSSTEAWGSLVYTSASMNRHDLFRYVDEAYREFYDRSEWRHLAVKYLGDMYPNVERKVEVWFTDRLALAEGRGDVCMR